MECEKPPHMDRVESCSIDFSSSPSSSLECQHEKGTHDEDDDVIATDNSHLHESHHLEMGNKQSGSAGQSGDGKNVGKSPARLMKFGKHKDKKNHQQFLQTPDRSSNRGSNIDISPGHDVRSVTSVYCDALSSLNSLNSPSSEEDHIFVDVRSNADADDLLAQINIELGKDEKGTILPPTSLSLQSTNSVSSSSATTPTFTLTTHKKVVLPKLNATSPVKSPLASPSMPETPPKPPPRGVRHSSISSSLYDGPSGMDGNVLRKVASITLEKNKVDNCDSKISRPKVPTRLDLSTFERFEGQQLLNWLIGSFQENNQLNDLLNNKQDLRIILTQFCTNLLAAGVLRQCDNAQSEKIFQVRIF